MRVPFHHTLNGISTIFAIISTAVVLTAIAVVLPWNIQRLIIPICAAKQSTNWKHKLNLTQDTQTHTHAHTEKERERDQMLTLNDYEGTYTHHKRPCSVFASSTFLPNHNSYTTRCILLCKTCNMTNCLILTLETCTFAYVNACTYWVRNKKENFLSLHFRQHSNCVCVCVCVHINSISLKAVFVLMCIWILHSRLLCFVNCVPLIGNRLPYTFI